MLVEQSSDVSPLTPVSSPHGSHHHHRHHHHHHHPHSHHLSLNHTTHLSPVSQSSSHSPSDSSSSPQDDSCSTTSTSTGSTSTPLKTLSSPSNIISQDNFNALQRLTLAVEKNSLFSNLFGEYQKISPPTSVDVESGFGSDSPPTIMGIKGEGGTTTSGGGGGSGAPGENNSNNNNNSNYGLNESSKILVKIPLGTPESDQDDHGSDKSEGEDGEEDYQRERRRREHNNDVEEHLVPTPTTSPNGTISNHSNIFQCPLCSVTCTSRHQFNEHLVSHSQQHACAKCSFITNDEDMLLSHMQEIHDISEPDAVTDDEVRVPKVNSQGKLKTFKCKQCDYSAVTKMEFWDHSKSHIRQEKMLTCPKCPFVTEYKHHLEYHLRNHFGSKPFQCSKCSYSCVNKSMLNSHLKSHSNVYQYRCADCSYATKYCHSLKLHLRKYNHNPSMVLNLDGTPNPLPIIDVYGTRRGPKMKRQDPNNAALPPASSPEYSTHMSLNSNKNPNSNSNGNLVKNELKKRCKRENNMNNNSNNNNNKISPGAGSGENGTRSPVLIKRESFYEDHNSPPLNHYSHNDTVSGSESNSDSEQESHYHQNRNHSRSFKVQQRQNQQQQSPQQHHHQQQQQQLIRHHQLPETPVTPTSLGLHGLLSSPLGSAGNGHTDQNQFQAAAAAAAAAAAVAGKNPLELYAAAINQYFLANNPLLHMAPPLQDLAKLAQEQQHQMLSQILQQSSMMPQSQSASPPPLIPTSNGHSHGHPHGLSPFHLKAQQQQQQQQQQQPSPHSHTHVPLDLRNPRTTPPSTLDTPVIGDLVGEKRKRKGKAVRYDRKLSIHPMNLAENLIIKTDPEEALDFSNNNNNNNYNNSMKMKSVQSRNNCSIKEKTNSFQSSSDTLTSFHQQQAGQMMCKYCEISFPDRVLYSMHMSYHSGDCDPFLCKSCGKKTQDKISFFHHLTTDSH